MNETLRAIERHWTEGRETPDARHDAAGVS